MSTAFLSASICSCFLWTEFLSSCWYSLSFSPSWLSSLKLQRQTVTQRKAPHLSHNVFPFIQVLLNPAQEYAKIWKKNENKRVPPQGLLSEVPQLLTEGTLGAEHHVQGVAKAGRERVLKCGDWLMSVRWLPLLVWDGNYRCVWIGVFFWNAFVHLERGLKLDLEFWDTQIGEREWVEVRRMRQIGMWMKLYLVEGRWWPPELPAAADYPAQTSSEVLLAAASKPSSPVWPTLLQSETPGTRETSQRGERNVPNLPHPGS